MNAEYTTSRELLEGMAELAHEYKQPVYLNMFRDQMHKVRAQIKK